jgi:ADP-ribose pyrophosphatase
LAEGWKRLGSERLLANRYFSLRSDRLRLPDGGIKDPYFILERPDAAIVFPITADDEVVLVRQYRPPLEMMELGLPAGLVEEGERPEEAARRELAEETGYTGEHWELIGRVAPNPALQNNTLYTVLARGVALTRPPAPDDGEVLAVETAALADCQRRLVAGEIDHALVVVAFAHLALRRGDLRP